ncbi:MAG: serine hydrolase [Halioglobus sp.]
MTRLNFFKSCAALVLLGLSVSIHAERDSSSAELGIMEGFPPEQALRVSPANFMTAPNNRWSFQHIRELQPTREVSRGEGPVSELVVDKLDLGAISTTVRDNRTLSLAQFLDESHTDSFLILHKGEVIFEQYMNGMGQRSQHQMFSATKSFVGTLMLVLMEQGRVDPSKKVVEYLPEVKGSAFADATVQQVLDMTAAIHFTEVYDDPNSEIWRYGWVFGVWGEPPADYVGPRTIYDYLPSLKKKGEHGQAFHYVTPNTDVIGWIISRVTGKSISAYMEEVLWQKLGVERDGYMWLDRSATEMAGGGLNITARDAARFGQMIIEQGHYNGQQIIPKSVAARILKPGNPKIFTPYYPDNPWHGDVAYAYHDMWWTFNNAHKAVSAIGVHGQYIYMDPKAEMVVVKQSSSPDAEGGANDSNDVDGPLLYQALAEYLNARAEE